MAATQHRNSVPRHAGAASRRQINSKTHRAHDHAIHPRHPIHRRSMNDVLGKRKATNTTVTITTTNQNGVTTTTTTTAGALGSGSAMRAPVCICARARAWPRACTASPHL